MKPSRSVLTAWLAAGCLLPAAAPAFAQTPAAPAAPETPAAPAAPAADAPPPGYWINGIHLSAQIEGGITVNPAGPANGQNFGQLFTDRANQPLLNQLLVTANKPLDPKATDFDWGFKLQGMYGSDARYTHILGEFDQNPGPAYRNQFNVVEANVLLHLPFPTDGGMDVKIGQYPTPLGYETIDPSTNPFYSHSYIFNFGLPFEHVGFLTTTHVTSLLDVYLGLDTGVNTSFGPSGDDNDTIAGVGGIGLNMMDGNLTVLALTHIGPENASRALAPAFNANSYMRYLNDLIVTWKASDKLTLVTEGNWIRDDYLGIAQTFPKPSSANAYGVAQYVSYTLTDTMTINLRGEVYRDDSAAFVFAFPGNNDFVRSELGLPNGSYGVAKPTTYGEITIGATFKPDLPAPITGLLIRPELRVDSALSGGHPYNTGTSSTQLTLASDFVLTF
jgi:hypothetical protein